MHWISVVLTFLTFSAHASCKYSLSSEPTVIVVGLLFNAQGQVLLGQRQPPHNHIGRWEFPGGKLELFDSSPRSALAREWKEEVGADISVKELILQQDQIFDEKPIQINYYRVELLSADESLRAIVHSQVSWVGQDNLSSYPFIVEQHPIWKIIWR